MEIKSKTSAAQKRASKKYKEANMSKIALRIKFAERDTIIENAIKYNLPKARYVRNCVKYCIDHDINMKERIENGEGI